MRNIFRTSFVIVVSFIFSSLTISDDKMELTDIFGLEYAAGLQVSPDSKTVLYERRSFDIMTDRARSNLWLAAIDGSSNRPILSGKDSYRNARWSPKGDRIAYVTGVEGSPQIYVRFMDSGATLRVTDLTAGPSAISWSPDGKWLAFAMFVPSKPTTLTTIPKAPKGAKWAGPAKVVDRLTYRFDGRGFLPNGFTHIFVVPAHGGSPRQVTKGDFNHGGTVAWTKDSKNVILSANRSDNWEYQPAESELYKLNIASGGMTKLTDRRGPDASPQISPDGKKIAYLGYDDKFMSSQANILYVMDIDGGNSQPLTATLDRAVNDISWSRDGRSLYFSFDDHGKRIAAKVDMRGKIKRVTDKLGGTTLGRPYTSGEFAIADGGRLVYSHGTATSPADIAVNRRDKTQILTDLNGDLLGHKALAQVSAMTVKSSVDGRDIEAWVARPADFDPTKKYPLILEIHGGPHAAYGPQFSSEIQLYAAAGYMVVWSNPRGSTSYGHEFANLIHHNYPSSDYDDLMDVVDGVVAGGAVDEDRLFVTGGSGGGVLTAWIVGKTDRFKAAVVAKPVINWTSFALTADIAAFVNKYWFPAQPWEAPEHFWERSPLSLVGNVSTPTMLLTGEVDYRTPMGETEQYYQALKLRKIDTVMVRIPGASHGIAAKPSNLMSKVANILAWFEKYDVDAE